MPPSDSPTCIIGFRFCCLERCPVGGTASGSQCHTVCGVFFIKTLYSILLCVLCLLTNTPFPFVPIQITLIDLVIEGYPSFFLSFLPDSQPVRTKFLPEAIRRAAPNALAIGVCFLFYLVLHAMDIFGLSGEQTQANTLLFLLIGTVGLLGVFKMCLPFTKVKAFLQRLLPLDSILPLHFVCGCNSICCI